MAERLTWLLNGCYLWEGEVESPILFTLAPRLSCSFSLFLCPPFPPIPSPELLVVMAVMTEKTKRGEIVEMGGKFRKGADGKDC